MTATYEETLDYLQRHFLTLDQLSERSGLASSRLEALIDAGLMPAHSHEATFRLTVYARVNGHHPTEDRRVRYYHPDLAELATTADAAAQTLGLSAAAATIRAQHDAEVCSASSLATGDPALRDLADDAWWMWRDGTIGVCLQRFAPANIVRKSEAVEAMAAALERAATDGPDSIDRAKLDAALGAYAAHAGPFGPHERHTSTRARIYEPALTLAARIDSAPRPSGVRPAAAPVPPRSPAGARRGSARIQPRPGP
jgi:hypothetical protein